MKFNLILMSIQFHGVENVLYGKTEPTITLLYDVELVTICYSPERLEKYRIMLVPKMNLLRQQPLKHRKNHVKI